MMDDFDPWERDPYDKYYAGPTYRAPTPPSTTLPIEPVPTVTPVPTGGGKTPEQIEAEGREYDRQHGYIGGYMMNGQWINGSPYGGGIGGGGGGGYASPERRPLGALNYPGFNAPSFTAPPQFAYKDYQLPTSEEIAAEPGFDFALKQGIKAYENSKAYLGTYKTGGTIKGLNDYAHNMAQQNAGNVIDRSMRTYELNRNNAADAYATNYGISRDVFDRNYQGAKDMYAPKAREAELNFARDWDVFAYEGDDDYRRWKALVDANS